MPSQLRPTCPIQAREVRSIACLSAGCGTDFKTGQARNENFNSPVLTFIKLYSAVTTHRAPSAFRALSARWSAVIFAALAFSHQARAWANARVTARKGRKKLAQAVHPPHTRHMMHLAVEGWKGANQRES